jgi:hypothetical protein
MALSALGIASRLYETVPGATAPLIVATDLSVARWHRPQESVFENHSEYNPPTNTEFDRLLSSRLSLAQVFACLLMFETASSNIDTLALTSVMAMSSGNSIYVATKLLSGPETFIPEYHITRIVGNVGLPGITMVLAPHNPRLRGLTDDWRQVRHAKYDFKREDNFRGTTLHLSFTDWKLPLEPQSSGTIDKDVHLMESVISVHDSGEWVADLDLIRFAPSRKNLLDCRYPSEQVQREGSDCLISIDNWDELIDSPRDIGIFRAKGNWAARLAASSILSRKYEEKGGMFYVCSSLPCLQCAKELGEQVKIFID